jgi:hypothetical protein
VSADDRLKKGAARVNAELDKMAVPASPNRGGSRVLAFALGAVATLAVIAGAVFLIGNRDNPDPIAAGGTTTTVSPDETSPTETTVVDVSVNYRGNATVLDDGNGPVLCAGGVMESYPPQCSGPALAGLDWADVPWADSASGVTWADIYLEVSLGEDGTLTLWGEPSRPGDLAPDEDVDFTPPCPAPAGGWVWTDGPKTSQADFDGAMQYAQSQPDLSATWVFNLIDDPYEADQSGRFEVVLVALFTGNVAEHQAAIEELWGGPLCVAEGVSNSADLLALQDELTDRAANGEIPGLIGFGYSYPDEMTGTVVLGTLIATDEAYQWLEANYPEAPVRLDSQLQPVVVAVPQAWEEPANYSFVVESTCGERALIGVFEVVVVEHKVSSATGRDSQAEAMLESGGLVFIPTIAEMLAEAAAAEEAGADEVTVTYADDGTPQLISIDYLVNAIDDEACYLISEFEAS